MTLEQAKAMRNAYLGIIGKPTRLEGIKILDVIAVPEDEYDVFLGEYRQSRGHLSNDQLIGRYPSNNYEVKVVLDYAPDVHIVVDDLDPYKYLSSETSK